MVRGGLARGAVSRPYRPLVVGVGGPSCSGKTTIVRSMIDRLGHDRCLSLCLDSYYRDLSHLAPEARAASNFDEPDAIEVELLSSHLRALLAGRDICAPTYDFARHVRGESAVQGRSAPVILLEGTLALYWPDLRALFDVTAYVHLDPEECLRRRLARDVSERGRTEASVRDQWRRTVWPMHLRYVEPTREYADIVVWGGDHEQAARVLADAVVRGHEVGAGHAADDAE